MISTIYALPHTFYLQAPPTELHFWLDFDDQNVLYVREFYTVGNSPSIYRLVAFLGGL